MKLWEYSGKHIKIIDIDGRMHIGLVELYTSEFDEPDGVATISLRPDGTNGYLVDFTEDEIASIEVLPAVLPVIAEAV